MTGPMNPYDAPELEPRGMSGTTKVLLAFGIGCGVLLLLCCGVLGFSGFAGYRYFRNAMIDDPARVRQITDEIVAIEIPESLEPKMAMDMRVPFSGEAMVKGSAYMGQEEKSYLIIGEANPEMEGDTGEMEIQFKRSMRQRDRRETQHFEVAETEPFDTTIHDQPAHFTLSRVVDKQADEEQWRAEGSFQGLGGPAILLFEGRSPEFDKQRVLDMLKSMK